MDIYQQALIAHEQWQGKLSTELKMPLENKEQLSIAYTPGVAAPCVEIAKNPDDAYRYTSKANTIAVISDGTAVLGLGDIGAVAALPVMEGKCALFKAFAGINAVPLVLDTKDPQEIITTIEHLAPTFGGINLEDISAPRCVEIERALVEKLNIPVFHDDQHGTAIVVCAALINALKVVQKDIDKVRVVVLGVGAAGSSIIKLLISMGVKDIIALDAGGVIRRDAMEGYNAVQREIAQITNPHCEQGTLSDFMPTADVFIGVSRGNLVSQEMVRSMKEKPIVFAMANPQPEIMYEEAKAAGAAVAATGRSDMPNQINNVLVFPGIFKGALMARARKITDEMKRAAAYGLASMIDESDLREDYIIVSAFEPKVADVVAQAVIDCEKNA